MMKTSAFLFVAIMLSAGSLFAADALPAAKPSPPPSPPAVNYEVWGFRWDGHQFVKQPNYTLITTDLKKAVDYVAQINRFSNWTATTNVPDTCMAPTSWQHSKINNNQRTAFPSAATFSVWAFKLTDGKWVKDAQYCWTTSDPDKGTEYAKKLNAASGWSATDNCPPAVARPVQQYVYGSAVPGGSVYLDFNSLIRDAMYGKLQSNAVPAGSGSTWDLSGTNSVSVDSTPAYDNTADIQNMVNTQNMLNLQDMINTQNMVNNIQDMVNTQNMVNEQNMINAMQSNP